MTDDLFPEALYFFTDPLIGSHTNHKYSYFLKQSWIVHASKLTLTFQHDFHTQNLNYCSTVYNNNWNRAITFVLFSFKVLYILYT